MPFSRSLQVDHFSVSGVQAGRDGCASPGILEAEEMAVTQESMQRNANELLKNVSEP